MSAYGRIVHRSYDTARALALEIISCLPETIMGTLIADAVVVEGTSCIRLTSSPHMEWHLTEDRHPCRYCGIFCKGAQGIRTHLVREHHTDTQVQLKCFT